MKIKEKNPQYKNFGFTTASGSYIYTHTYIQNNVGFRSRRV